MAAMAPPPPPPSRTVLPLLSLPEDALAAVAAYLPFTQRLQLSLVCRKLRQLCAGPSAIWRRVEAVARLTLEEGMPQGGRLILESVLLELFSRWLAPRAPAVEELCFAAVTSEPIDPNDYTLLPVPTLLLCHALTPVQQAGNGTAGPGAAACPTKPLPLVKLAIEWPEAVLIDGGFAGWAQLGALPCLRKLAFPDIGRLEVRHPLPQQLTDFSLAGGTLWGEPGVLASAWLPPSTTALYLESCGLRAPPPVLAHLPNLRSLALGHNRLTGASLKPLTQLQQLEEVNLSEAHLPGLPHQLSMLTTLRVLYMHGAFSRHARVLPADWDVLRPLGRLAFLSISGNQLEVVPPSVAALRSLQALHVEDNELLSGLPRGPYLATLQELLLDWQAALDSPAALAAATGLTRLVLTGHRAVDEGPGPGLTVRPAEAAEPLLAALAAMPALRAVEDVFGEEDTVTAPVAHVMWQLGRRCPQVALRTIGTTDIGWSVAELDRRQEGTETELEAWPKRLGRPTGITY